MDRLTIYDEQGVTISKNGKPGYISSMTFEEAVNIVTRLAAYEDTGLEPAEIVAAENRRHDCNIECPVNSATITITSEEKIESGRGECAKKASQFGRLFGSASAQTLTGFGHTTTPGEPSTGPCLSTTARCAASDSRNEHIAQAEPPKGVT